MVFALEAGEPVAADGEKPGREAFHVAVRRIFGETEEGILHGITGGFGVAADGSGECDEGPLKAVEGGQQARAFRRRFSGRSHG